MTKLSGDTLGQDKMCFRNCSNSDRLVVLMLMGETWTWFLALALEFRRYERCTVICWNDRDLLPMALETGVGVLLPRAFFAYISKSLHAFVSFLLSASSSKGGKGLNKLAPTVCSRLVPQQQGWELNNRDLAFGLTLA